MLVSSLSDEEIVKSHVELSKIKHEPTSQNFFNRPTGVCFCVQDAGTLRSAPSSAVPTTNSFSNFIPPVEVVELTACIVKKLSRLEREKSLLVKKYSLPVVQPCHQAN